MSPLSILNHYWHHDSFRPMQEEIIQSVLERKDTLALLPTGGGKSVCFQVPALLMDGLCLVISPLIALMQDQVESLNRKKISAAVLHSGMTMTDLRRTLQQATQGTYKFLYVSPERLESAVFREYLPALDICLIVVDEAHCISQWGYDFRPSYLRIAALRDELPETPLIALTASATPGVQQDIIEKLKLQNPGLFRQSFERPNLSYSVFSADSRINKVTDILNKVPGSSIVYCGTRKQTKEITHLLSLQHIAADYYHAGLSPDERLQKQQAWISGSTRVMVCTNAFGMGIDKPDVRTVIHYDVPDCIENYYQEAGRAGRDGKKSFAVLLHQWDTVATLQELPDKKFPPIAQVQHIYQALADYLHVPVGNGEGLYYDFDLATFIKNFQLDLFQVINTLKILEQEGHISFTENIFLPTQVMFTADRNTLETFQQSYPDLEELVKCMLRTYEGILDNRVSIQERQLARLCRMDAAKITGMLQRLQAFGIIEYLPQKQTPQIHYLLNRAPAKYLHIDQDRYLQRKQLYTERVNAMIRFIELKTDCRSRYIASYFGDPDTHDCGICDNCLTKKRKEIPPAEFDAIKTQVLASANTHITVNTLLTQLRQYSQEKIWAVIGYLQDENIIYIDDQGMATLQAGTGILRRSAGEKNQ